MLWLSNLSISVKHFVVVYFPQLGNKNPGWLWLSGWSWHSYADGFGTIFWRQRCERTPQKWPGRSRVTNGTDGAHFCPCNKKNSHRKMIGMGHSLANVVSRLLHGPTVFYWLCSKKKICSPVCLVGWPLVFGRLFVSGVFGWPKCYLFLGEVTKCPKWFWTHNFSRFLVGCWPMTGPTQIEFNLLEGKFDRSATPWHRWKIGGIVVNLHPRKKHVLSIPLTCWIVIFRILYMDVSENRGTPKSSILIGFSHYKPSIFGIPLFFGNTHMEMTRRYGIQLVGCKPGLFQREWQEFTSRKSPVFFFLERYIHLHGCFQRVPQNGWFINGKP